MLDKNILDKSIKEKGIAEVRTKENKRKLESRKRKMKHDPTSVHNAEKKRKRLSRLVDSAKKRIRKFLKQTMFNAVFTCSCCQRNLFDCNVSIIDSKLITDIDSKNPDYIQNLTVFLLTKDLYIGVNP